MSEEMLMEILRQMFYTTALLVLPILGVTLVIGIAVSIFQAVTNIQEQTLVFIPKILGVMLLLFFLLPWIFQVLSSLTLSFFDLMVLFSKT
ncbi:MAG: flagellar biosynthetic protein FliQ [Candidatus Brocadiae bacterium]|nr:flagellar biosynthetic protein FliQ [Candidatus Brocadiia bacterium]